MTQHLLTLIAPPALEESLIDWLLERPATSGFLSMRVETHGSQHGLLTIAEQVSGRQRKVMFQVKLSADAQATLIEQLQQNYRGAGIEYWTCPISDAGLL